jgi:hypothetical protein
MQITDECRCIGDLERGNFVPSGNVGGGFGNDLGCYLYARSYRISVFGWRSYDGCKLHY